MLVKKKNVFLTKMRRARVEPIKDVSIRKRSDRISLYDVLKRYDVHNGRQYISVSVKHFMVGFKFGDFAFTRKISDAIHTSSRSKRKKK